MKQVVVDARVVRRVIKRQRGLSGLGLDVPHGHCCVIERSAMRPLVSDAELGESFSGLPGTIVLVARPDGSDVRHEWRRAFHGFIHHRLDARALTPALVRERINRIGQTEFDEVRAVLRGEALLFSKSDDREAYVEFAAFYLELRHFEPEALHEFFPNIQESAGAIEAALAGDVDVPDLLERSRPAGAEGLTPVATEIVMPSLPVSRPSIAPRESRAERASVVQRTGNVVRSIIRHVRSGQDAAGDIDALADRLEAAVGAGPRGAEWSGVVKALALALAAARSPRAVEARLLYDMQKACLEAERPRYVVDAITWIRSGFRRPIVRPLPVTNVVRVARHLQRAFATSHRAALSKRDRRHLEHVFHAALRCARDNARFRIKPALEDALAEVGLAPRSVPERVARDKLCEEVVDLVLARGTLGLSQLRDALSRSNLKLPNVRPRDLAFGDPLLRADTFLARRLDGVYRAGEIYLRFLQKLSSVAFGTRSGRALTRHVALPLLLSFVLLEGLQHIAHPLGRALGHPHVHLLSPLSFVVLAIFFYGVIHSVAVREAVRAVLRGIGAALHAIFIEFPRIVLSSEPIRALLRGRLGSLVAKPALCAAVGYVVAREAGLGQSAALLGTAALAVLLATFLGTPVGMRVDEAITESVLRHVRELSRHVLPGLFALVLDVFRVFVERVERAIYTVDEWLTFGEAEGTGSRIAKGVLGALWFLLAYLLRIYVNVLIEPQVNPIKHFPVVTVSHKIILPLSPTILAAVRGPLAPLGLVVSNTVAGSTVFLLPGAFGFLVWELKENFNLYDQNRSPKIEPLRVGHHGETMHGLLVAGFHSGTLPKLYAKLRRAARRGQAKENEFRAKLHDVEHALETFVERELVGLLREAKRWSAGALAVHAIQLSSNRVRLGITCEAVAPEPLWIHFEEQSGRLIARVAAPGFVSRLEAAARAMFETALAGLYKRAGVDIVREQVEALLGAGMPYDIAEEGLVVWPSHGYETEIVYDLAPAGALRGVVRGAALDVAPRPLDAEQLLFARQDITWAAWVEAFRDDGTLARVITGPSLLRALDPADRLGQATP